MSLLGGIGTMKPPRRDSGRRACRCARSRGTLVCGWCEVWCASITTTLGCVGGRCDLARLGRVRGERLLAEHVLAGLDRRDGPPAMEPVRQRDVDRVDPGRRAGPRSCVGGRDAVLAGRLRPARGRGPRSRHLDAVDLAGRLDQGVIRDAGGPRTPILSMLLRLCPAPPAGEVRDLRRVVRESDRRVVGLPGCRGAAQPRSSSARAAWNG